MNRITGPNDSPKAGLQVRAHSASVDLSKRDTDALEDPVPAVDFVHMPGHMVRKLQQVQVALFMDAAGDIDLPPVQFAALAQVAAHPHTDQASLARAIAYDPVTIGGVVARLEKKGWIRRDAHDGDRRVKRVSATPSGLAVLKTMHSRVEAAQIRLLSPLSEAERQGWLEVTQKLLDHHRPRGG